MLMLQVPVKFAGTSPPSDTELGFAAECALTANHEHVCDAVVAQVMRSPASSSTAEPGHVIVVPGVFPAKLQPGEVMRGALLAA